MNVPQSPSFDCGDWFAERPLARGHSVVSPAGDSSTGQRRGGQPIQRRAAYLQAINVLAKLVLEVHSEESA